MDPAITTISWADIIKLALSAGIISALLNQIFEVWRDWRKDHRDNLRSANYTGLRVAITLETFALTCVESAAKFTLHIDSSGHAGSSPSQIPTLGAFPRDIEWKSIDPNLAARALAIPLEIESANRNVSYIWDVTAEHEEAENTAMRGIANCGMRAWAIASDIRKKYGLPSLDIAKDEWDPIEQLTSCIKKLDKTKE